MQLPPSFITNMTNRELDDLATALVILDEKITHYQSLHLEDWLEAHIVSFISALKEKLSSTDIEISDIIDYLPQTKETLEYHLIDDIYQSIEEAITPNQRANADIQFIAHDVNTVVVSKLEDPLLTYDQAHRYLFEQVYKTDPQGYHNIKLIDSKVKFIQFYFATESQKQEILSTLQSGEAYYNFVIAMYETIKKHMTNFNPQVNTTKLRKIIKSLHLTKKKTNGGSHKKVGIFLFDPSSTNQERAYNFLGHSFSSVRGEKVWLDDITHTFAQNFKELYEIANKILEENQNNEHCESAKENFSYINDLLIVFIECIFKTYKVSKLKK